jgi:hypothetical protein
VGVDIEWINRGLVVAKVGRRTAKVGGEALLAGDPDFVVYASSLTAWSDGTPMTAEEKVDLLDDLVDEAQRRGWKFEIAW